MLTHSSFSSRVSCESSLTHPWRPPWASRPCFTLSQGTLFPLMYFEGCFGCRYLILDIFGASSKDQTFLAMPAVNSTCSECLNFSLCPLLKASILSPNKELAVSNSWLIASSFYISMWLSFQKCDVFPLEGQKCQWPICLYLHKVGSQLNSDYDQNCPLAQQSLGSWSWSWALLLPPGVGSLGPVWHRASWP